jgi:outer membrane protein TolC
MANARLGSCFTKTDSRSVLLLLLAALSWASPAHAQGLNEIDATRAFCEQQPEKALAVAYAQKGSARVSASKVLPNPSLSLSHERVFGGAAENETVIGVGVPLGIGGRRFLLQDAAAAWRAHLKIAADAGRIEAALAFRRAFVVASVNQARLGVQQEQQGRFATLIDKLNKLAAAGEGSEHDRLRLQTEADLYAATMVTLDARVAAQRAWLQAMAGAPVALATEPEQWAQRVGPVDARADHPQVASLRAAARAHGLEARAADRRWVPDLDVFAGYRVVAGAGDTGHGFSIGVSFPLTFFDYGQGEVRRAQADRAIATAEVQRIERDNRAGRRAASARASVLEKSAVKLSRALVDADKVRVDTERLYLADEGSLLAVLEAHRHIGALAMVRLDIAAELADARLDIMVVNGRFGERRLDTFCGGSR